jgi:hypothetical protein
VYQDPLGPTVGYLVGKGKTYGQIINAAARPNGNINGTLAPFKSWLANKPDDVVRGYHDSVFTDSDLKVTPNGSQIDAIGDGRPVSGYTGFLQSPRLNRSELQAYKVEMESIGINFVKNGGEYLPPNVRGGFNWGNQTVYLRKGATDYEAYHEVTHAKQFSEIGRESYEGLGRYSRESHVFNDIYKNRHRFSYEERTHAVDYMRDLRERYQHGLID